MGCFKSQKAGDELFERGIETHRNILCDKCDARIVGRRYKSKFKHDYDLCSLCFHKDIKDESGWTVEPSAEIDLNQREQFWIHLLMLKMLAGPLLAIPPAALLVWMGLSKASVSAVVTLGLLYDDALSETW